MRRIFVAGLLVALLIPVATSALSQLPAPELTMEQMQAQVQQLLARVAELTKLLEQLRARPVTPTPDIVIQDQPRKNRICLLLNRTLTRGQSGDDVIGLQEFLRDEGHLTAAPTGFFGQLTEDGVRKWQTAQGVDAIGIFGPVSRDRIKLWCNGGGGFVNKERFEAAPVRGDAPLSVSFSTWIGGLRGDRNTTSWLIDFGDGTTAPVTACSAPLDYCQSPGINSHTYASNGTYNAALIKRTNNNCTGTSEVSCATWASRDEIVGKAQIRVGPIACTLDYNPVCGSKQVTCITTPCNPVQQTYSNRCAMEADGATFVKSGACTSITNPADDPQCKRWTDGKYCGMKCFRDTVGGIAGCAIPMCQAISPVPPDGPAQCLEYFNNSGNRPPVISSFSGPTTLTVGGTGTWTVNATDPENQTLTYRVEWGEVQSTYAALLDLARSFVQTTTFTHVYSTAGLYTVTVVVQDQSGNEAKTTTTVNVGNVTVGVGCWSGGVRYEEGYKTTSIINANGTVSSIADAYYVCRGGQWKIEGGLTCTAQYVPVCGRPKSSCDGFNNTAICAAPIPVTYGNSCSLNAAGATFLYNGPCASQGAIDSARNIVNAATVTENSYGYFAGILATLVPQCGDPAVNTANLNASRAATTKLQALMTRIYSSSDESIRGVLQELDRLVAAHEIHTVADKTALEQKLSACTGVPVGGY